MERISKKLASLGIESRRNCEKIVLDGRVKINNTVITDLSFKVSEEDLIHLDGKQLKNSKQEVLVYAMNKPKGCLTTTDDPMGRATVYELIPKNLGRLVSIGRLDYNTEGLLLFTNSGDLKREMELPSSGIKRTYKVRVFGRINERALKSLANGITIDGVNYGKFVVSIEQKTGDNTWLTVEIWEGKNREIRKVLEDQGLIVNRLIRTQYGKYNLGDIRTGEVVKV